MMRRSAVREAELDASVESVLRASRALVGVAARSLTVLPDDLTLPQFRALVFIAQHDATSSGALADALGVHPSSITRLVDRLVAKRLVARQNSAFDRREIRLTLTARGRSVVERVTRARRRDLTSILKHLSPADRSELTHALNVFALAAGEAATESWSLGWASA